MVILIVRWTVNPLVELLILAGSISVAVIHTSEPYPMLNMKMYTWSQHHADHGEDDSFDDRDHGEDFGGGDSGNDGEDSSFDDGENGGGSGNNGEDNTVIMIVLIMTRRIITNTTIAVIMGSRPRP